MTLTSIKGNGTIFKVFENTDWAFKRETLEFSRKKWEEGMEERRTQSSCWVIFDVRSIMVITGDYFYSKLMS